MNLTITDYYALSPLLILFGTALLVLLFETFDKKRILPGLTFLGLLFALYATQVAPESVNPLLTPWLKFDALSKFFTSLFVLIGIGTLAISSSFFKRFEANR